MSTDNLFYASPTDLCNYISVIKYISPNSPKLNKNDFKIIENFPSEQKIKGFFSLAELRVLFHSVQYIWNKLTGGNITEELKIKEPEAKTSGCYWVLENGLMLSGDNHVKIIKNYMSLFSSMLNINTFSLIELLSTKNKNKLISLVINHGAVRMYVKSEDKVYIQMTGSTFDKWGREKIENLKYKEKYYKIIDPNSLYKGWESGIYIKLVGTKRYKT